MFPVGYEPNSFNCLNQFCAYQDLLTDWLTVSCNVTLTLTLWLMNDYQFASDRAQVKGFYAKQEAGRPESSCCINHINHAEFTKMADYTTIQSPLNNKHPIFST
jgi:hypothetical protein